MKSVLSVLLAVCAIVIFAPFATAGGLEDILRQGSGVVLDTQKNKSSTAIDAERRKRGIDADAQKQVDRLDALIEANDRRIREDLDPDLMDARVLVHDVERNRVEGMISRSEYVSEKRAADNRVTSLRNSITALKQQNAEYARQQKEILANAETQKRQVDRDAEANANQATTRQNSNILDQLIRGIGR